MALPRKRPATILKRDREFTQAIGKPASDKPNPYNLLGKELVEKLEAARPSTDTDALLSDPIPAEKNGPQKQLPAPTLPASHSASDARDEPAEDGRVAPSGPPRTSVERARAKPRTDFLISFRVHSDLVSRAEDWAASVGLPVSTVLRNCFNRFKPDLLNDLKIIKAADVRLDRAEGGGHQLQSRMRITPAEAADLEARLDPAGFGVTNSLLNSYTRSRFSTFLEELLSAAGY